MLKMAATNSNNIKEIQSFSGQRNVQIVRAKVTTKCLWNACKALSIGLLLMTIGAAMAVVGYYADQLSVENEIRGNSTIRIKNESRGFHLNNLSYAGPIVMGVGGFIVVAACVMTFEARDSAAKVVPARFRTSANCSDHISSSKSTPHTFSSLHRLDNKMNVICSAGINRENYKMSNFSSGDRSPINDPIARKLFTSAFIQFSRDLMENSSLRRPHQNWGKANERNLSKSPSAPNLSYDEKVAASLSHKLADDRGVQKSIDTRSCTAGRQVRTLDYLTLLSPQLLQRQALSMDNPFYKNYECFTPPSGLCSQWSGKSEGSHDSLQMELGASAGVSGSQASMALDLHECQVTLTVKDESQNRRSDTSRRHQLLRQRPVEDEREIYRCPCSPQMSPIIQQHCCKHTEDSITKRSDFNRLKFQSVKLNQILAFTPGYHDKSFSQSRSCTDEKPCSDSEQKIHFREQSKRSEKLKRQRCTSEHAWSPELSPSRTGNLQVHSKNEEPNCMISSVVTQNRATLWKSIKRNEKEQELEENSPNEEREKSKTCRPSSDGSPSPTSVAEEGTTRNDSTLSGVGDVRGSAEEIENAHTENENFSHFRPNLTDSS